MNSISSKSPSIPFKFSNPAEWTLSDQKKMEKRIRIWSRIQADSYNQKALQQLLQLMEVPFKRLGAKTAIHDIKPWQDWDLKGQNQKRNLGPVLIAQRLRKGKPCILLMCHADIVISDAPPNRSKKVFLQKGNRLWGPGVCDAKGGIAVLLSALEHFERSDFAQHLGWKVMINSDEEIGSPGSMPWIKKISQGSDLALVYEPALPDGSLVGQRKGSGNFSFLIQGRSSHAGRFPQQGRNAIELACEIVLILKSLNKKDASIWINTGKIEGGGPVNKVPDLAIIRCNARVETAIQMKTVLTRFHSICKTVTQREGYECRLEGEFRSAPKAFNGLTLELFQAIKETGRKFGMALEAKPSGGVCDGNKLASLGIANVDTMGPVGGAIHSPDEYLDLDSLIPRAALSTEFLKDLAQGKWPRLLKSGYT